MFSALVDSGTGPEISTLIDGLWPLKKFKRLDLRRTSKLSGDVAKRLSAEFCTGDDSLGESGVFVDVLDPS
jgi:hypothetical protein